MPAGHAVHSVRPVASAYVPARQLSQPSDCDDAPVLLPAVPAGHGVHVPWPVLAANEPPPHCLQCEAEELPVAALNVPVGHS